MNRAWNIVWKIALGLAIPGIVLVLIGLKLGWPQSVVWGSNGPRVIDTHDVQVSENNLQPFDKISVDAAVIDVRIARGDHYGLTLNAVTTYLDTTWANQDGTLTIHQTRRLNVMGWYDQTATAIITVPDGTVLTSIDVTTAASTITCDVPAATTTLISSAGDATLTATAQKATVRTGTGDAVVDAAGGTVSASSSTGDTKVTGKFDSVTASSDTGNVVVSGSAPQVDATSSTGDVTITLDATWAATTYLLHTSMGDVRLFGPGAPSSHSRSGTATGTVQLNLTASTSIGDIRVTLGG